MGTPSYVVPALAKQIRARWGSNHFALREIVLTEIYGLNDSANLGDCISSFTIKREDQWGVHHVTICTKGSYGNRTKELWVQKNNGHFVISASKPEPPSLPAATMPRLTKGRRNH